jgi:ankyrin repeat protein
MEDLLDDLLDDVKRGDLASVQARIGADRSLLNALGDPIPYTALGRAAYYGHLHIARYLVGEGAQVNQEDGTGSLALRSACRGGRQAMVELLLEAGADAVGPNEYGDTPLMSAASRGHAGIIRALLAHGCGDIDARDHHGRTALWWACLCNNAGVALVLLEAGADMKIAEIEGITALDRAREPRRHDCGAVLDVSTQKNDMEVARVAFPTSQLCYDPVAC